MRHFASEGPASTYGGVVEAKQALVINLLIGSFLVEVTAERVPELKADLEDFGFLYFRDLDKVADSVKELRLAVTLCQLGVVL